MDTTETARRFSIVTEPITAAMNGNRKVLRAATSARIRTRNSDLLTPDLYRRLRDECLGLAVFLNLSGDPESVLGTITESTLKAATDQVDCSDLLLELSIESRNEHANRIWSYLKSGMRQAFQIAGGIAHSDHLRVERIALVGAPLPTQTR